MLFWHVTCDMMSLIENVAWTDWLLYLKYKSYKCYFLRMVVCVLVYILCLFDIVAVLYSHNTDSPSFPLLASFPSFFSKNGYWEPVLGIFKIAFALILKLISWLLPGITTIKKKEDLLLLSKSQDHQILSFLNVLLPLGHCICHYPHPVISVSSY